MYTAYGIVTLMLQQFTFSFRRLWYCQMFVCLL